MNRFRRIKLRSKNLVRSSLRELPELAQLLQRRETGGESSAVTNEVLSKLEVGQVIKLRHVLGVIPWVPLRVTSLEGAMVMLSLGEIEYGVALDHIVHLEWITDEKVDWLQAEVDAVRAQVAQCPCPDCEKFLRTKEAELRERQAINSECTGTPPTASSINELCIQ